MAYIKYKELTKYFNFKEECDVSLLPKYATDYLSGNEKIISSYKTKRDLAVFTNKSMILFDSTSVLFKTKKVHIIPYDSISTGAIEYKSTKTIIHYTFESGYQIKLNFVITSPNDKTRLRMMYTYIMNTLKH